MLNILFKVDLNATRIRSSYGKKYDQALKEAKSYYEKNIVPKMKEQFNKK